MIGRRTPAPGGDPTSVRLAHATADLAALTAQQDQAVATIDSALRDAGRNRRLADFLLDVRLILRPPARP